MVFSFFTYIAKCVQALCFVNMGMVVSGNDFRSHDITAFHVLMYAFPIVNPFISLWIVYSCQNLRRN